MRTSCSICENPISRSNTTGLCRSCARRNRGVITPRDPGDCKDCGKRLGARNQSGYCMHCSAVHKNADPEFQRARAEAIRRKFRDDPEYAEKIRKAAQRMGRNAALDPDIQAARRAWGKKAYREWLNTPEVRARSAASPTRAQTMRETRLAWCPVEMRERYRFLTKRKRIKAAEAREIIWREWPEVRAARHPCFSTVIDFMRHRTAVFDHGPDKEKRYRVGLVDLTAGELLKRAEFNGYQYPSYLKPRSPNVSLGAEDEDGKIAA